MSEAKVFRLIGWAVVAIGAFILVVQVRSVVANKHALPDIRHEVLWSKSIHQQARRNRSHAVAGEIASLYLIEKLVKHTELIVDPKLAAYRWYLEHICRNRVMVSADIRPIPSGAWKDLELATPHTGTLDSRPLFVVVEPGAKTYVFVSSIDQTDPLYVVPETLYRSRAVDKSGANLRAP